jgi:peptidoglycan/xylan/chitin deacetylase (PgdA/CDA1 family)
VHECTEVAGAPQRRVAAHLLAHVTLPGPRPRLAARGGEYDPKPVEPHRLSRRRSRLPLILAGCLALVVAVSVAMAALGVQPAPQVLSWLSGGSPATASPGPGTGVGVAASGSSGPGAGTSGPATPAPATSGSGVAGASAPAGASGPAGATGPGVQTVAATQAKAVYHGSRAKKVVALTFDDGYNPVALRQILAILKREKITATFFPYGWAVAKDPAGWKMVVAAGYPIGNHTQSHATLTQLTPAQVTSEMVRGRRTIDLYSGAPSVNLMRPPGGAFNAPTARAIAKASYNTIVMWDVDTSDWQGASAATIKARAIRGTNGSIVLMHSGPLNTPKALPGIIASYRARGFTFVTVPELIGVG